MPFYEYQCKSCGHDFEAMQNMSESSLRKCPHCGKSQLQRLMSAPVFRLKGAGWYETDFKSDKDGKRNLADQPDADAPKVAATDATAKDDGKAADAKGQEATAADGNSSDASGKDAGKSADKADKAAATAAESTKKSDAAKKSDAGKKSDGPKKLVRRRSSAPARATTKRPGKKPAPKLKRRR